MSNVSIITLDLSFKRVYNITILLKEIKKRNLHRGGQTLIRFLFFIEKESEFHFALFFYKHS